MSTEIRKKPNNPRLDQEPRAAEHGFTLIELLVASTVLVIIGGVAFKVFDASVDIYRDSQSRVVMAQKCRVALDFLSNDLSAIYAARQDESLVLISQDNPGEFGDRDIISFVTLVHTDPDPFLAQLNQGLDTNPDGQAPPVSDVQRVAYVVGPELMSQDSDDGNQPTVSTDGDEEGNLVLTRVITTSIDPQTVIASLLDTGTIPAEDDDGNAIYADIAQLIDHVASFDLKYSDGEDWYESWEQDDAIPSAVQILISVLPEGDSQRSENAGQNVMTLSTMIHLPMSADFGGQDTGGQPAGALSG